MRCVTQSKKHGLHLNKKCSTHAYRSRSSPTLIPSHSRSRMQRVRVPAEDQDQRQDQLQAVCAGFFLGFTSMQSSLRVVSGVYARVLVSVGVCE